MKRALVVASIAALALACRSIAGIEDITLSDAAIAGDGGMCSVTPTLVVNSQSTFESLASDNAGNVYSEVLSTGVGRCAITGCSAPTELVTALPSTDTFFYYSLEGSLLYYTAQGVVNAQDTSTMGSVHSVGLDGSNDQTLASNLAFPGWVGVTGTRVFWVDDISVGATATTIGTDVATVSCIGCSGSTSTPWITHLNTTYVFAVDENFVWIIADADGNGTTANLFSCSTKTACSNTPQKVLTGLDAFQDTPSRNATMVSDGTYAYLARAKHNDIVRVDTAGNVTQLVTGVSELSMAVDAANGWLYFSTDSGIIDRTKTDGSTLTAPQIVGCGTSVDAIALDDQHLFYSDTVNVGDTIFVLPKPN